MNGTQGVNKDKAQSAGVTVRLSPRAAKVFQSMVKDWIAKNGWKKPIAAFVDEILDEKGLLEREGA